MQSLKRKAKDSAQRAALVSTGAIFCMVGLGFLTLAGWFFLAPLVSPLEAALILAGVYFGVGFLLFGIGLRRNEIAEESHAEEAPAEASNAPPLLQAFLYGMQAGARARSARK